LYRSREVEGNEVESRLELESIAVEPRRASDGAEMKSRYEL